MESTLDNEVLQHLLRQAEADPLPAAHTSAHWRHYGPKTRIERRDGKLSLQAFGFDAAKEHYLLKPLRFAERVSYRSVSRNYRHYESAWKAGAQVAYDMGGAITFNAFAAILASALLMDHFEDNRISPRTAVIIGDGAGFLGALLRRLMPDLRLYLIDLPKMLVFQAHAHLLTSKVPLAAAGGGAATEAKTVFLSPDAVEQIEETLDLAVNIDSMQEMNPASVSDYFRFLRARSGSQSRFYCLNRESKVFSDGTASIFSEYPWRSGDQIFLNESCPFHTHFLDWRPPFYHRFDGPSRHRLVRLESAISS